MHNPTVFVIPMAGESSRFRKAGFDQPKYMLPAFGKTVFDLAIGGFSDHFKTSRFIFITNNSPEAVAFVQAHVAALGLTAFECVQMQRRTKGQAETVALGLQACGIAGATPITIFNIDSFRLNFALPPADIQAADGYLEVFKGAGDHWSFAKTEHAHSTKVIETAEKVRISDLCSNGLYHFSRAADFLAAYAAEQALSLAQQPAEFYIAPLYNRLIATGQDIRAHLIANADTAFCGIPTEYRDYLLSGAQAAFEPNNPLAALFERGQGQPLEAAQLMEAATALSQLGRTDDAAALQVMAEHTIATAASTP